MLLKSFIYKIPISLFNFLTSLITSCVATILEIIANITGYDGYLVFQLVTVIYGCIVYVYECIIACLGIMRYEWDSVMRNMFSSGNSNDNQYQPVNTGYNNGYGSLGGNVNQQTQTVNAFSGRGVTMV